MTRFSLTIKAVALKLTVDLDITIADVHVTTADIAALFQMGKFDVKVHEMT